MDRGDEPGGSFQLARLTDEAGDYLIADFRQYYGLSFSEAIFGDPGLPVGEVLALVRQLPPESRTVAHLRGGEEFVGWGSELYMMANIYDAIRENTFVLVSANSKRKPKAPEPMPRPKSKTPKKTDTKPQDSQFAALARMAFNAGRK